MYILTQPDRRLWFISLSALVHVHCEDTEKFVCVFRASGGELASASGAHPPRSGVPVLQSAAAAHVTSTPHLSMAHHDH